MPTKNDEQPKLLKTTAEKISHMQKLVTEGIESGTTQNTLDDILAQARKISGQ